MAATIISAALALTAFKGQAITVQEANPVTAKGEDGKDRIALKTREATLAERHVVESGAKLYEDGTVTITTVDGRRHVAKHKLDPQEVGKAEKTDKGEK